MIYVLFLLTLAARLYIDWLLKAKYYEVIFQNKILYLYSVYGIKIPLFSTWKLQKYCKELTLTTVYL